MKKSRSERDLQIMVAISGSENPLSLGIQIEDDYLLREKVENRKEHGYRIPRRFIYEERTDFEKQIWKHDKLREGQEVDRWLAEKAAKTAHLEDEFDEDRQQIEIAKPVVVI